MELHSPKNRKLSFEPIAVGEKSSFAVKEFQPASFPFKWHFHPELELTLIVKGRGLRYVGDSIEEYGPGDLCLLGANLPHTWFSDPNEGTVHSIVIQFRRAIFGDFVEKSPEFIRLRRFLDESGRGFRFTGKTRSRAESEMRALVLENPDSPRRMTGLLTALVALSESAEKKALALAGHVSQERKVSGTAQKISEVLRLIHSGSGADLSQEEIASRSGMSPAFFSRWFKKTVGKNFVTYVTEGRVALACRTLLETDRKIVEIALESGFHSLANFNRQFKAVKGMTPKDYRRRALRMG